MAGTLFSPVVIRELTGTFDNQEPIWFDFETKFPYPTIRQWFRTHKHWSIYLGIVYIAITLTSRKLMEKRQRFELRGLLLAWNVFMALFSLFMAVRVGPFFFRRLYHSTLYGAICDGYYEYTQQIVMWLEIFVITKAIEFIDTAFIVLRKQHLAFIHWYHHATVVIVCWYAHGAMQGPTTCIYYVVMNSIVHSVMYTYYGLRAARIRVPRFVNMMITSMQIGQMFLGILINALAVYYMFLRNDRPCDDEPLQIFVASSVYLSYFFLFCKFFYETYLIRKPADVAEPQQRKKPALADGIACSTAGPKED